MVRRKRRVSTSQVLVYDGIVEGGKNPFHIYQPMKTLIVI